MLNMNRSLLCSLCIAVISLLLTDQIDVYSSGAYIPERQDWQVFVSSTYGYEISHPPEWSAIQTISNLSGPEYLIRNRVWLHKEGVAGIHIDVWDNSQGLELEEWLRVYQSGAYAADAEYRPGYILSGKETIFVLDRQNDYSYPHIAFFLQDQSQVLRIEGLVTDLDYYLPVFFQILSSFRLAGHLENTSDQLPDIPSNTDLGFLHSPTTNCCGYSDSNCNTFYPCNNGNCTWWGRFKRPDAGGDECGGWWGNANLWDDRARQEGFLVNNNPKEGGLVIWETNHVAYIEEKSGSSGWMLSDMDNTDNDCSVDQWVQTSFTGRSIIHVSNFDTRSLDFEDREERGAWFVNSTSEASTQKGAIIDNGISNFSGKIIGSNEQWNDGLKQYHLSLAGNHKYEISFDVQSLGGKDAYDPYVFLKSPSGCATKGNGNLDIGVGTTVNRQINVELGACDDYYLLFGEQYAGSYLVDNIVITEITDTTPPTLASNVRPSGWTSPYTNDTTPAFQWNPGSDAGSGMAGYYVAVDDWTPEGTSGNDWWAGNVTNFTLPSAQTEGQHIFAVTSKDNAGNVNPQDTNQPGDAPYYTFYVDLTAPQSTCTPTGNGRGGWYNSSVTVNCHGTDALSGVDAISYTLDGGAIQTYSGSIPVSGEGSHQVVHHAADKAGNVGTDRTLSFGIDLTAPAVLSFTINNGGTSSYASTVVLGNSASDNLSGLFEMCASHNQLEWTCRPYATEMIFDLPALNNGTFTNYFYVVDLAGHQSAIVSDTIALDFYPPMPTSGSYRVCSSVIPAAGGTAASANYALATTAGETGGVLTSSSFVLNGGFAGRDDGCATQPIPPNGYQQTKRVVAAAGQPKTSATYAMAGTFGQPVSESCVSSSSFRLDSGFWGGCSAAAPQAVTVAPAANGGELILTWVHLGSNSAYEVYRSQQPFFDPAVMTPIGTLPAPQSVYTDTVGVGDTANNFFYVVRAKVAGSNLTSDSNRVGEFDFPLVPGSN